MATTAGSPAAAALLLPYLFIIVLLQPVLAAARPLHAPPAACAGTGVQPVALVKPLGFCGGQIGDPSCCGEAKDAALGLAFIDAFSKVVQATTRPGRFLCGPSQAQALRSVSYSGLIVAPDGSGRVLVWNQQGEVWLASMPAAAEAEMQTGAATPMRVDDSPFIDLSGLARYDEARGLRGLVSVVSHPRMDGRLFESYTTTTSDDDCGAILVVEELTPGERGFEHTTVFSIDLPANQQAGFSVLDHGGQIFFRPNDPSLYLVTGHGVSADLVSSNKSSLLGKILRLHVDHDVPAGTDAEVFFSGLNIPRGCALDYYGSMYCANIDETQREMVYLISDEKAANSNPSSATSAVVLDLEHPTDGMAPSIVWGLRYQGSADASLSGRYLYAYDSAFWSVVESPPSSGHYYTPTRMLMACSRTTPMPCQDGPIVVSFAEDKNKESVILATDGVYRIVASSLCAGGPPVPASRGSFVKLVAAVLGSVLGVMGTALVLALVICKKLLEEDGKDSPCLSIECFRDCTCICCCS